MLTGLLFLAALVAVALVVHWAIVNDGAGDIGETTGIFAMRVDQTGRDSQVDRKFRLPGRR
ncbi:MAG: hypothetical protein KIT81_10710 [Alphaproteobacteria bacterium]|nr:hypothetical protein [Alphaproteobacteria bacterium]